MVVSAVGVLAYRETRQRERDRHAILAHVEGMERIIRDHDTARIFLHVEGTHPAGAKANELEEVRHRAILDDIERLAHLRDFALRDVEIELKDDAGIVRYRVEGQPGTDGRVPPAAGEIQFMRFSDGWRMTGHRLIEAR